MPNWVSNDLAIECDNAIVLMSVCVFLSEGERLIDFNKVVPCPPELNDSELHTYGGGEQKSAERDRKRKEAKDRFGFCNSVDFATEMWGTKWNACDIEHGGIQKDGDWFAIYKFKTAWCPPLPVIIRLSERFLPCKFHLYCTEECGNFDPVHYEIKGGKVVSQKTFYPSDFEQSDK